MLTVQQAEALIIASRPHRGLRRGSAFILFGISMLLGALLAKSGVVNSTGFGFWLILQASVAVVVGVVLYNTLRQRRMADLLLAGFEALQLRQWDRARQAFTSLLRTPMRHHAARAESLMALAAVAEASHAYETSQHIYEAVLDEGTADALQLHMARVALGAVMLRTGQTTDAVSLIDRLTRAVLPDPLSAHVEMLSLFREVNMGQTDYSVARAELRRRLFRDHLSTRAGYGYALMAAAFDRANRPDDARRYWHDATLLVPSNDLTERFAELVPVAGKYATAEVPL